MANSSGIAVARTCRSHADAALHGEPLAPYRAPFSEEEKFSARMFARDFIV